MTRFEDCGLADAGTPVNCDGETSQERLAGRRQCSTPLTPEVAA